MEQQQRYRVGRLRLHVQEVDTLAVDLGRELRMGVDPRLGLAPIEGLGPLLGEFADERNRLPMGPVGAGGMRPARAIETDAQIFDGLVGDRDGEGGEVHFVSPCRRSFAVEETFAHPS